MITENELINESILRYKIVLLGDGGIGKTALIHRLCYDSFSTNTEVTIGVHFYSINFLTPYLNRNFETILSIWDFGGQERFKILYPQLLKGTHGVFLIFDLTSFNSLNNIYQWYRFIVENLKKIPVFLIGTKKDIIDQNPIQSVNYKSILEIQKQLEISQFIETSSKTNYNVEKIFKDIIISILDLEKKKNSLYCENI